MISVRDGALHQSEAEAFCGKRKGGETDTGATNTPFMVEPHLEAQLRYLSEVACAN